MTRQKKSKKNKLRNKRLKQITSDEVSISDFADAENADEKLKKISRGLSCKPVIISNAHTDDIPWYAREDWDSDQLEKDFPNESHPISTGADNPQSNHEVRKKKQKGSLKSQPIQCTGTVYPTDLWFVLSCYIVPEQVQTFALICQGANTAVNTKKFWMHLYWCHCGNPWSLPDRLQPDRIESRPGLKSRIIRALFHCYEPLKYRLLANTAQNESPDHIQFMNCCSLWFKQMILKKQTKVWAFYFKFAKKSDKAQHRLRYLSKEWFDKADFISANPELDYFVLQVNCKNFLVVPPSVIGQILTSIFINVSQSMRHSCVKLTFHNFRSNRKYRPCDGLTVTLDPVFDYRVMQWWHPLYPHHSD